MSVVGFEGGSPGDSFVVGAVTSDLGDRAARSARHLSTGQIARFALHACGLLILSRLLPPEDFGYVAIATTILAVTETVRDLGLSAAAIRAPELSTGQRDVLFWINTGIGAVIAALLLVSSGWLGGIFDEPALVGVVQAIAVVPLINGATTQYRAGLQRSMHFRAVATIDVLAAVSGLATAIVLALTGAGYWALVAQAVVIPVVTMLGSIAVGRWAPGLPRRAPGTGALLAFGMHVSASQVLIQVGNSIDTLAVGWTSSASAVGYYNRAYQLAVLPMSQIRAPATMVATSVLSKLQGERGRLASFVETGQTALLLVTLPITATMIAAPHQVVAVILGPQWTTAAPVVAVLSVAAAMQGFAVVANWIFVSTGNGRSLSAYSLVSLLLKVGGVLSLAWAGPLGVAAGLTAALVLAAPIALIWATRSAGMRVAPLFLNALTQMTVAAVASCAAWLATLLVPDWPAIVGLLLAVAAVVAVYAAAALIPAIRAEYAGVIAVARRSFGRG